MSEKHRLLVVDDEDAFRVGLSNTLLEQGYEVTTASDGEEAIALIKSKKIDLVLLDINMPKMDGYEVLAFIKKNYPFVKVVMLTAFADLRHAMEAKRHQADDFLSKPPDLLDLYTTIERLLEK
ncbi:MAG: response regulator [Ignavibacteriae bacterium]|nr:response regulator [Ignavibacteriota bacterium]